MPRGFACWLRNKFDRPQRCERCGANVWVGILRANTEGQAKPVFVRVPLIADTIDEQLYALVNHKADIAAEVIGDEAHLNQSRLAAALTSGSAGATRSLASLDA